MTLREASGCPISANFDPLSEDFLSDPYAVLAGPALANEPVFYAESIGYYVIARYADIEPLIPAAQQILLAGGHRPQQPQATSFAAVTGRGRWPCRRRQRITR
jgi:hypothetical protein